MQRALAADFQKFFGIRAGDLKPAYPGIVEPRTGMSMGQHTEKMVKEWSISRAEQDQLAYESHVKAAKAYEEGFYNDPHSTIQKCFARQPLYGVILRSTSFLN